MFLGPFARDFPEAEVYAAPGQWSWPLNLPLSFLGLFPRRLTGTLADSGKLRDGRAAPWADELDHVLLELPLGLGPFVEVVFFHKESKTLLVTDVVISVPADPPEVRTREHYSEGHTLSRGLRPADMHGGSAAAAGAQQGHARAAASEQR